MKSSLYFSMLGLTLSMIAMGCAPQANRAIRERIITRPAQTTGAPSATEVQARDFGININWESTSLQGDHYDRIELRNIYTLNSSRYSLDVAIPIDPNASCEKSETIPYSVSGVQEQESNLGTTYSVMGFSICRSNHDLYLGLSFMSWNQLGLTQQFAMINLNNDQLENLSKTLSTSSQTGYLPDWLSQAVQSRTSKNP